MTVLIGMTTFVIPPFKVVNVVGCFYKVLIALFQANHSYFGNVHLSYFIDAFVDRLELLLLRMESSSGSQSPQHVDDPHVDLVSHGRGLADLEVKNNRKGSKPGKFLCCSS